MFVFDVRSTICICRETARCRCDGGAVVLAIAWLLRRETYSENWTDTDTHRGAIGRGHLQAGESDAMATGTSGKGISVRRLDDSLGAPGCSQAGCSKCAECRRRHNDEEQINWSSNNRSLKQALAGIERWDERYFSAKKEAGRLRGEARG